MRNGTRFAAVLGLLLVSLLSADRAGAEVRALETVASFGPGTPPGNVAVGPQGRVYLSLHQFYEPELRVVELQKDGSTLAYPPHGWNQPPGPEGIGLNAVLGLVADRRGVLWLLDNAMTSADAPRLLGWDTRTNRLDRSIYLPMPMTREDAFLNDLAVDRVHGAVYVADTAAGSNAALIVVDLATGHARRVLEGHRSVLPEDVDMVIDGRTVTLGGAPARIGVNPITVDPAAEWVYFGPMSGTSLYRVRTSDLLKVDLPSADLAARVERYGDKPISDGITVDGAGNVYITDITANAIGVTRPDGRYEILYQDDARLSWPDGFAFGPDEYVYVTVNQLHRSPVLADGGGTAQMPFLLLRFPALASGSVGR